MKKIFFSKNSSLTLLLLLFILILSVRSGKYTYLVNSFFFVTLFINYKVRLTNHSFKYMVVIVFLTIWGVILGNDYLSILEDIFAFSPLILLFIERTNFKEDLNHRLPIFLVKSLYFMIPVAFLIFKYMDYEIGGIETTRFKYNAESKLSLFGPILPIIFAPTLFFFFDIYSKKQKALVFISSLMITLMGIITLTKSVIIFPIIPLFLFFGYKIIVNKTLSLTKTVIVVITIGFVIMQLGVLNKIGINNAVTQTLERTKEQNENGRVTSGRVEETLSYLNQNLNFLEYLIGRGIGGHKVRNDSDNYTGGVNMMHFGPAHVFMKGGILLLLVLYIPLFLAIFKFWKTPNYHISLILFSFFLGNIQTTSWSWGIGMFFYWYGISEYFTSKQKDKSLINNKYAI